VSSYLAFSPFPLTDTSVRGSLFSVALSVGAVGATFLLGSTMPCVARTFLPRQGGDDKAACHVKVIKCVDVLAGVSDERRNAEKFTMYVPIAIGIRCTIRFKSVNLKLPLSGKHLKT